MKKKVWLLWLKRFDSLMMEVTVGICTYDGWRINCNRFFVSNAFMRICDVNVNLPIRLSGFCSWNDRFRFSFRLTFVDASASVVLSFSFFSFCDDEPVVTDWISAAAKNFWPATRPSVVSASSDVPCCWHNTKNASSRLSQPYFCMIFVGVSSANRIPLRIMPICLKGQEVEEETEQISPRVSKFVCKCRRRIGKRFISIELHIFHSPNSLGVLHRCNVWWL